MRDELLHQANREAQEKLEEWNRFIENALDRTGYVDPGERQMRLEAWMLAEQRAGKARQMADQRG